MFKNISLGIYYPGDSLLHRLQARTKLLLLAWFTVVILLANNNIWHFAPFILLVLILLSGIALSGISALHVWKRTRFLIFLMVLGIIPSVLSSDGTVKALYTFGPYLTPFSLLRVLVTLYGLALALYFLLAFLPIPGLQGTFLQRRLRRLSVLFVFLSIIAVALLWIIRDYPANATFPIGPFVVTDVGTWSLLSFSAVFIMLYVFALLLTMTTTPIALVEGLTMLLTPLRWLRLPVDDFALMTLIALRFIPTLLEEVEQLLKAQTARGADYTHGTLRARAQSMVALFVPLMQGVLRRASDLATALEARGYTPAGRQTYLHETKMGTLDYSVLSFIVLISVGSLLL